MSEFEINGVKYSSRPIPAKTQLHLVRKITPLLNASPAVVDYVRSEDRSVQGAVEAVSPLANILATLPTADFDFVVDTCLSYTQTFKNGAWGPVWNVAANAPQFSDISAASMIQITAHVLWENLQSFLSELPLAGFLSAFGVASPTNQ